ncbi:MAG: hypothetical protein ACLVJ6_08365 [Merdibacter sp.]
MSHHQSQTAVHIGTGIAPLLMLFCLLCMTTFAVLSYVRPARSENERQAISRVQARYSEANGKGGTLMDCPTILQQAVDRRAGFLSSPAR